MQLGMYFTEMYHMHLFAMGYLLIMLDSCQFVQFERNKLAIPLNQCMEHRHKEIYYSTKYVCSNDNSMVIYNRYIDRECSGDLSFYEVYDSVEINKFECIGTQCPFVSVRIYDQLLFDDSDSDCMETQDSDFNEYVWIIDCCFTNYAANNMFLPTGNTLNHDQDLSYKIQCGFDSIYLQTYTGSTCTKHQSQIVIYDQTCMNDTYWEILTCSTAETVSCRLFAIIILSILLF